MLCLKGSSTSRAENKKEEGEQTKTHHKKKKKKLNEFFQTRIKREPGSRWGLSIQEMKLGGMDEAGPAWKLEGSIKKLEVGDELVGVNAISQFVSGVGRAKVWEEMKRPDPTELVLHWLRTTKVLVEDTATGTDNVIKTFTIVK